MMGKWLQFTDGGAIVKKIMTDMVIFSDGLLSVN